jgi:hypothetical protein
MRADERHEPSGNRLRRNGGQMPVDRRTQSPRTSGVPRSGDRGRPHHVSPHVGHGLAPRGHTISPGPLNRHPLLFPWLPSFHRAKGWPHSGRGCRRVRRQVSRYRAVSLRSAGFAPSPPAGIHEFWRTATRDAPPTGRPDNRCRERCCPVPRTPAVSAPRALPPSRSGGDR